MTIFIKGSSVKNGMTKTKRDGNNKEYLSEIGIVQETYYDTVNFINKNYNKLMRLPLNNKIFLIEYFKEHVVHYYSKYHFESKKEQLQSLGINNKGTEETFGMLMYKMKSFSADFWIEVNGNNHRYEKTIYMAEVYKRNKDEVRNFRNLLEHYMLISEEYYKESVV